MLKNRLAGDYNVLMVMDKGRREVPLVQFNISYSS